MCGQVLKQIQKYILKLSGETNIWQLSQKQYTAGWLLPECLSAVGQPTGSAQHSLDFTAVPLRAWLSVWLGTVGGCCTLLYFPPQLQKCKKSCY